jgi:hypothetical protein
LPLCVKVGAFRDVSKEDIDIGEPVSRAFCTLFASFVQRLFPQKVPEEDLQLLYVIFDNFRLFSILMGHQLRSIAPATGFRITRSIPFSGAQRHPTAGVRRHAQVAAETVEADVGKLRKIRKGCRDANEIRKSREMSEMIRR